MTRKQNKIDVDKERRELEEAAEWDRRTVEIRGEVYRKLNSWKAEVFPYDCSWTTFIHHLISEKEQRHLDGTPDRIKQLKLLDEEIYLKKSQERRYDSFIFSPEEVAD
jgi:predicted CopG family antitoxin